VTISGQDFTSTTQVSFDGFLVSFTEQDDTTILATAPAHTPGVVNIAVTTADGTSTDTASDDYTYIAAGVAVAESDSSTDVVEGGATDSYTVVLIAQPTDTVTVTIASAGEAVPDQATLTFETSDWNLPQTVVVTATNDAIIEGSHADTLVHSATGGGYSGVPITNVAVLITDNDLPGINVVQSGGSTDVAEAGGNDTYTIVLAVQPVSNVTVVVNGTSQATVAPTVLTFTNANWSAPQTVTVTAIDDGVEEGTHSTTISHTSSGAGFDGLAIATVIVNITDNDFGLGEVLISQSNGQTTLSEGGGSDSYTVVLSALPSGSVTIGLFSQPNQLIATPSSLVFTTANWNVPQTVSLTAIDDVIVEGTHTVAVSHSASGGGYTGVPIVFVTAVVTDNDSAGVILPTAGNATLRFDAIDDAFVRADDPNANFDTTRIEVDNSPTKMGLIKFNVTGVGGRRVTSAVLRLFVRDSSDHGGFFFATTTNGWEEETVTWTTAPTGIAPLLAALGNVNSNNWVEVDVSARVAGDGLVTVQIVAGSSNRVEYTSREHQNGAFAPELILALEPLVQPVAEEGGAIGSYPISLTSQPAGTVRITVTGDSQLQVTSTQLTFTPNNWNVAQQVRVIAIDDHTVEGEHVGVVHHVATGPGFTGLVIPDVAVRILDNDILTLTILESGNGTSVEEGGLSDTYTIVLDVAPSEPLVLQFSGDDQLSASPSQLTFTPNNWQLAQTVTVHAVDDSAVEGAHSATLIMRGTGSGFVGAELGAIFVTITDNDRFESLSVAAGLNLVGWFGAPTTSREILNANSALRLIWAWDRVANTWLLDSSELPNAVRVTITIDRGRGFFLLAARSTTVEVLVAP